MLTMTAAAQKYILCLLLKQRGGTMIRVVVTNVGTTAAECGICFCYPDSFWSSDMVLKFGDVLVRLEQSIVPFMKDAVIDLVKCGLDVQIFLKAPYIKVACDVNSAADSDKCSRVNFSSLSQGIQDVLERVVNPQLSVHGGGVQLVEVTADLLVILKFFGGCNGCSMARRTMQLGIEVTLKKNFPQLQGVRDVTEHYRGSHSYC